jgi:hypothetical protein
MKIHKVRSWSHFFDAIVAGKKTHDLRKDDRGYQVGDRLLLEKYDNVSGDYTGDSCLVEITYITNRNHPCAFSSSVLPNDYCILSIKLVPKTPFVQLVQAHKAA